MKLDPFYLIVDSADWIARLVPLGVKLVQLRIKERTEPELRHEIRSALAICLKHKCQLIINDYWRLAIEEGSDFVHLGQEDLETADLKVIKAAGLRLGISTHNSAELQIALAAKPDYVALGPIYSTVLKQMQWAPQGVHRLREWKSRIGGVPLVAIGGLNPERIAGVFDNGADAAAVVTDISRNAHPEERTSEWLAHTHQWRSPVAFTG